MADIYRTTDRGKVPEASVVVSHESVNGSEANDFPKIFFTVRQICCRKTLHIFFIKG